MQNISRFTAGTYKQQSNYKSFSPALINTDWTWQDSSIDILLEQANLALGALDAYTRIVPDIDLYISMHKVKEANNSSRIEGTNTSIDEVLMEQQDILPRKRADWQEVQNYIQALNWGIKELALIPLSGRLLRQAHHLLMQGVRGRQKNPGEFRTSQNWIGGSSLSDAVYIPPHHNDVPALMTDLEKFWHNKHIKVPHLIKIALSHYQFESIHPFLDGNGRIGRLLIILYLVSFGILSQPSLFISAFFEKHRAAYYDALSRVRLSNDLGHWIKFFLNGTIRTAKQAQDTFKAILNLKTELEQKVLNFKRKAHNARSLLAFIYKKPVFRASVITRALDIAPTTANTLLNDFQRMGIIKETTGNRRNRLYVFHRYLQLFME